MSMLTNCDIYGRLYNWEMAMNYSANPGGFIGICPYGWHLPSDAEWDVLMTAVGGSSTAGTKLKAKSGWNNSGNGTDDYGFSALPGGFDNSGGRFYYVGDYGLWWSATEYNASYAYSRDMGYSREYVFRYDDGKNSLYSVRCLQD